MALVEGIVSAHAKGPVEVMIVAPDTEALDPGKRDSLTDQRIAVLFTALIGRGIAPGAISTLWRADPADTAIHRDGPGLQNLAHLRIGG